MQPPAGRRQARENDRHFVGFSFAVFLIWQNWPTGPVVLQTGSTNSENQLLRRSIYFEWVNLMPFSELIIHDFMSQFGPKTISTF